MPEANPITVPSSQVIQYPGHASGPTQKLKLLDRLRQLLRSRHSFTMPLLESDYDTRTAQELLGHSDMKTSMVYTHVLKRYLGFYADQYKQC